MTLMPLSEEVRVKYLLSHLLYDIYDLFIGTLDILHIRYERIYSYKDLKEGDILLILVGSKIDLVTFTHFSTNFSICTKACRLVSKCPGKINGKYCAGYDYKTLMKLCLVRISKEQELELLVRYGL